MRARFTRDAHGLVFVLAVLLLAGLCGTIIWALSAARACVAGESLYSKDQKAAVRALDRYLQTGADADGQAFQRAIARPLAIGRTRQEVERDRPDSDLIRRGFIDGGNNPDDVELLVPFFRLFRDLPVVTPAMKSWAAADAGIQELVRLDRQVRALHAGAPDPALRRTYGQEIDRISEDIDRHEQAFSLQLGVAARWLQWRLLLATVGLAGLLILAHLWRVRWLGRRLDRSEQEVAAGHTRWALAAEAGRYGLLQWSDARDALVLDERAAALFDLPADAAGSMPARRLRERLAADEQALLSPESLRAWPVEHPLNLRFRLPLPDGGARHVELIGRTVSSPIAGGRELVGLVRDVSDEVRAQAAQVERDASLRADRSRREFLSRVSHELRTPLNAVIGFSGLMLTDADEPLSAAQRARLDRVQDAGQYLLRLVNDLLDLSRLETGELSLMLEPVDVSRVLQEAVEMLRPMAQLGANVFQLDEAPQRRHVSADAVRLKQVFVNILSNALKYNRPRGRVHIGFDARAQTLEVTIRDEGPGIPAQQQRDLFVPFRRLDKAPGPVDGIGLGLVISRDLMRQLGGALELASTVGQGTTVTVRLPLLDAAGAGSPLTPAALAPGATAAGPVQEALALYIEDEPVNLLLVEQYAARIAGLRLLTARDARSGIELARIHVPQLILLDMNLPDMSGLEVLARLRDDPRTAGIRVIVLSADAMGARIQEALAAGAIAYWTKPLSLSTFLEQLPGYLH